MEKLELRVEGMSCGHCVRAVTDALTSVDGVVVNQVSIGSATLSYDPARTSPAAVAAAVSDEGYEAAPVGGGAR